MISNIVIEFIQTHENMKVLPQKDSHRVFVIVGIVGLSFTLFSFKETRHYAGKYINFAVDTFF